MYGFSHAKTALEFDKIVEDIAIRCVSETGKIRMRGSYPLEDVGQLRETLIRIQEMREIYLVDGGLPIWEFVDIRILLNKIEPTESYLEVQDCLKVQNMLEIVSDIKTVFKKLQDKYPHLQQFIAGMYDNQHLLNQLKFTIEPSGRIFDNASEELRSVRKDINRLSDEIHIRINRILKKNAEFLQEEYITLRDGRLVLPVREFSVSKIPGIVHGQSGSGATYFVEPMAIVDLNNQMQKLIAAEKKEIIKILRRLASLIRDDGSNLIINLDVLNELDVLQAKAKYANENDATMPGISTGFFWKLKRARHPLLLKKDDVDVVPLDLEIGETFRELIISGPNAGGKTVALKSAGMLQLMFQCGFHVPVDEGSTFPICRQIFAVIGDEQSIEQDLSTFSSHIQSIQRIFEHLEEQALILVDEIGTGTEPSGGAALAIAILEQLNRDGLVSIISTHHNQLKAFASQTEGVQNAAMQFDHEHLTPLFTLEMGIPGSSYTFEICKRLGLVSAIIERAILKSGEETFKLDRLLADVVKKSQEYQDKFREITIRESELTSLVKLYEGKSDALKKQRKKLEKEAARRAQAILDDANWQIETAVRKIRESNADKKVIKNARDVIQKKKQEIASLHPDEQKSVSLSIEKLKAGMRIHAINYDIKGVISKVYQKKKQVVMEKDGMTITLNLNDIRLLDADSHGKISETKEILSGETPSANITNELDLRGFQVDDALEAVEVYLDKAVLSSWEEVRLIHGKGTGALKQAIHRYLSGVKSIASYRLGRFGEGDTGVTVVHIKQGD
jgi:DNA mismatch repair protein MutS2